MLSCARVATKRSFSRVQSCVPPTDSECTSNGIDAIVRCRACRDRRAVEIADLQTLCADPTAQLVALSNTEGDRRRAYGSVQGTSGLNAKRLAALALHGRVDRGSPAHGRPALAGAVKRSLKKWCGCESRNRSCCKNPGEKTRHISLSYYAPPLFSSQAAHKGSRSTKRAPSSAALPPTYRRRDRRRFGGKRPDPVPCRPFSRPSQKAETTAAR